MKLTTVFLMCFLSLSSLQAQEKLTVLLDWFINPDHAPLLIAQELGYFKNEGLEVRLIPPSDPNDPPKLLAAKQADIALSYQPNLYLLVAEGLPIARIGTLIDTPLNSLIVLADSSIQTIADLKGKTIGYSVGGFEDIYLTAMLDKYGLKLSDVTLISLNFSLSSALLTKKVDAVIGAFRNFELNQLSLMNIKALAFFPEEEGVPLYDELIFIVHQDRIHDQQFKRFLKAIQRAVIFILNNPEKSWEIARKAYPDINDPLNQLAWMDTLRRFSHNPSLLDWKKYQDFVDFLKKHNPSLQLPAMETYVPRL